MYKDHRFIVIVPCYNEKSVIGTVLDRIHSIALADESVVVDDGSTDHSADSAKKHGATVLSLSKTEGVGSALRLGINYAKDRADIIVIMAGNNKDEPKEIPRLLDPIIQNKALFVQGSRFMKGGKGKETMPFYRRFATRIHPMLFSLLTGKKVSESTNGFRAFHVKLLGDPNIKLNQSWLNGYELEPYLYYKAITLGYPTCEVPVTKTYPKKGSSYTKMIPIIDWWKILKPLFLLKLKLRS